MRQSRLIMGMPVHLEIADAQTPQETYNGIFDYFTAIDERFSTYKDDSEISRINRGEISEDAYSEEMGEVLNLADVTTKDTKGYFNVRTPQGLLDPSGIVKGWAIQNAAQQLRDRGYKNFYVEIGGDIQVEGHDAENKDWSIGIRNPFTEGEIVKVIYPRAKGVATSGTYIRGSHIYNPHATETSPSLGNQLVSLTVIGPNVYEADRFATAAFAMPGQDGLLFLEQMPDFEAYAIDISGIATMTSGFELYTTL